MLKNCWIRFYAKNTSSGMSAEWYKYYNEIHPLTLDEDLSDWAHENIGQYREHWQFVEKYWEEVNTLPRKIQQKLLQEYESDYLISSNMIKILKDTPCHD